MSQTRHELAYRGKQAMDTLADARVAIFGVGAIGSNLAVNLARLGVRQFDLVDFDTIEEHNVGTQAYSKEDVGSNKALALKNQLFREVGITECEYYKQKVIHGMHVNKIVSKTGPNMLVDCFDNSVSREVMQGYSKIAPVLHVGVNGEYGQIQWSQGYIVPSDAGEDICEYPLSRSLIGFVVNVATEVIVRFLTKGVRENYSVTLGDMKINREE